jgi:hypothetical protein
MTVEIRVSEALAFGDGFRRFAQIMANRLASGGTGTGCRSRTPMQDYARRLKGAVSDYERSGGLERLVDAVYYACLEFQSPLHPRAHFRSTDSGGRRVTPRELSG